eukprot:7379527-Prymnesium_polylepis.1
MHSTYLYEGHDLSASKCIDSITDIGANFCMSETNVADPWVSVELAPGSSVQEVRTYAQVEFGSDKLFPYQLWVSGAAGTPSVAAGAVECGAYSVDTASSTVGIASCGVLQQATFVTVLLPGTSRTAMIAEVQVWGAYGPPTPPAPPPPSEPP